MSNSVILYSRDSSSPKNGTAFGIYSSKSTATVAADKFVAVTKSVKFLYARDSSSPKNGTSFFISATIIGGTDAMRCKGDVFGNAKSDQKHRGGTAG